MNDMKICIILTGLLTVIFGCGNGGMLKEGEILKVTAELRQQGETTWDDGTEEAFTTIIPKGTELKVLIGQKTGVSFIECVPVKLEDGNTDGEYIKDYFLPPHLKQRIGLIGFSVVVNTADVGTKLERMAR